MSGLDPGDLVQMMVAAFQGGDAVVAEAHARELLEGDSGHADALHVLALLAMQQGRHMESLALMRRSVTGNAAENPAYVGNFARALARFGGVEEAETWLRRAIPYFPDAVDIVHAHALCLQSLKRGDEAEPLFHRVLALDPRHQGAANGLGVLAQDAGRLEEARQWFERGIRANPQEGRLWFNLGDTLLDLHRPREAEAAFRRAIRLDPGFVPAHVHLAYALLMRGALREGFREYLVRWKDPNPRPLTFVGTPKGESWRGGPLAGKTLLLYGEQGFGDTLQFVRYAGLAAERGAHVLLVCQPELAGLMASARGVHEVVTPNGIATRAIDCHAALMDMPHYLDTTMDDIPAPVPYVTAPQDRVAEWRERLGAFRGLTVAVAWRSHPRQPTSPFKSCPLAALAPLFQLDGVRLVSVQTPLDPRDGNLPGQMLHVGGELRDFSDTAAILAIADVVVTVDTAVAHLAGALGRPTRLMLCTASDWRWFLDRDDSPWYPTIRLVRQRAPGDWNEVGDRVAGYLAGLANPA